MVFRDVMDLIARNGVWVMVISVVAIGSWFRYREHELKVHQDLRLREMEHEREMKKLEVGLAQAKSRKEAEWVA